MAGTMTAPETRVRTTPVLCVDLDGTLVNTDTLAESILLLLKRNPFWLLVMPFWLLAGRAHFKRRIAQRCLPNPNLLPYNPEVCALLRDERAAGRELVLVTGADEAIARQVADHLGYFGEVLASDGKVNLSGRHKLAVLEQRYGAPGFDYAGNSRADLPIWQRARRAILVNANPTLAAKLGRDHARASVCPRSSKVTNPEIRSLRVHQWVKNVLLFAPLIASHKVTHWMLLLDTVVAFVAFSLCASGVYVINDLLDLESDRQNNTSRYRPFAVGDISVWAGFAMGPLFIAAGLAVSLLLSWNFTFTLLAYLCITLLYSLRLKTKVFVDIMVLCVLYTMRVIAGGAAIGVTISPWLLGFSIFLFMSLALMKRVSELRVLTSNHKEASKGRAYRAGDVDQLENLGSSAGYLAALVLALYVNSPDVQVLYAQPRWLWLLCLLVIYWINRAWVLAHRGTINEDPVVFALKDKATYVLGAAAAVIMLVAIKGVPLV